MTDFNPGDLTAAQLRAARALLGWRAQDVADRAGVHLMTIRRAEGYAGDGAAILNQESAEKIVAALIKGGVVFIPARRGGEGVRLKR